MPKIGARTRSWSHSGSVSPGFEGHGQAVIGGTAELQFHGAGGQGRIPGQTLDLRQGPDGRHSVRPDPLAIRIDEPPVITAEDQLVAGDQKRHEMLGASMAGVGRGEPLAGGHAVVAVGDVQGWNLRQQGARSPSAAGTSRACVAHGQWW